MKINMEMNCTPLEFLEDLVNKIYGHKRMSLSYFLASQHPQEQQCLAVAEEIFEMVVGDSPEYADMED